MADAAEVEALVVGAGPTGLTLACELLARGIRVRIIDQAAERSDRSRALVVQPRTLELFQRMGIALALVARGSKTVEVLAHLRPKQAFRVRLGELDQSDTPFPFLLFASQVETEEVLVQRLTALGGVVERPVKLVSFIQDATGVTAQLQRGQEAPVALRARYLAGCDGAHSVVRKGAGLRFEGAAYPQRFLLADVELDWAEERVLHFFPGRSGLLVVFPLREGYRVLVSGGPTAAPAPPTEATTEAPLTLDEAQRVFDELTQVKARLHSPRWLARFHLHHRGVDHYRVGRAFVAGDAAHIHSPAGGQGMNTGIQDAFNLGWKLALVLLGRAPESLLDSYEAERAPVGRKLLRFTDRLFALAATSNKALLALRNLFAPLLLPLLLGSLSRRARALRFISQLGIRYRNSPIVSDQLSAKAAGPAAGCRAPEGRLGDSTIFARIAGTSHSLLVFGAELLASAESVAAAARIPIEVIAVEAAPELSARYGISRGLCLLRPDGYIGWRGERPDQLADYLARVFGNSIAS